MYEVTNASDIQSLRLILYEMEHSQTVEVRISELEKLLLFNDLSPLLDQIEERIRTVYCDPTKDGRNVLNFRQDFTPAEFPDYIVQGEEEYDILDYKELHQSRKHADSDGEEGPGRGMGSASLSGSIATRSRGGRIQLNQGSGSANPILTDNVLASVDLTVDSDEDTEGTSLQDSLDSLDIKSWNWAFCNRTLRRAAGQPGDQYRPQPEPQRVRILCFGQPSSGDLSLCLV